MKTKIYRSNKGYNLAAKNYDKKEAYLNSFEKGHVLRLMGDAAGLKVLDVGAGTGRLSLELARRGAEVTALDASEKMIDVLQSKGRDVRLRRPISTMVGDAENLPFADSTFDWVVAAFVIVHLKDLSRFFDEAYRILKDGGRILVTNINQKEPPEVDTAEGKIKIESYYHHPGKIREMLESLAFGVEKEIFVKEKDVWVNQILVGRK